MTTRRTTPRILSRHRLAPLALAISVGLFSPLAVATDYTQTIHGPFDFSDGDTVTTGDTGVHASESSQITSRGTLRVTTTAGLAGVLVTAGGHFTSDGTLIVETSRDGSDGVSALVGTIDLVDVQVRTTGADGAVGLVSNALGTIRSSGTATVRTEGDGSDAVWAGHGTVTLADAHVTTSGDSANGLHASHGGTISSSGTATIRTEGVNSDGVLADGGTVTLAEASVATMGDFSFGLYAREGGDINSSGTASIRTEGFVGDGVRADGGTVTLADAEVTTKGDVAIGLNAIHGGDISSSGTVTIQTEGDGSDGVRADGVDAIVTLADAQITTTGHSSAGLAALSEGAIETTGDVVIGTAGEYGAGVVAFGGSLSLVDATVTTNGGHAFGFAAHLDPDSTPGTLSTLMNTGTATIRTEGDDSHAVFAEGRGSVVHLADAHVTTTGEGAFGLMAFNGGLIDSTGVVEINTQGAGAHGVVVRGGGSTVNLAAGSSITTSGAAAHGFVVADDLNWTFAGGLPDITVSGDDAAVLAVSGTGLTHLFLRGETALNTRMTAGANTWGVKVENSGAVSFLDDSSSGGTALWVADNSRLYASDRADLAGSHVRLDGNANLIVAGDTDRIVRIGSLESDSSTAFLWDFAGSLTLVIGTDNADGTGTLRDADFAGRLQGVDRLIKTGATTQGFSGLFSFTGVGQTGNVGSVEVQEGVLAFRQSDVIPIDGEYATLAVDGDYITQAGATTLIAGKSTRLRVGGTFTQAAGATLDVVAGTAPAVVAGQAELGGRLVVNGLVGAGQFGKASEVLANGGKTFTVIRTANGITGAFDNAGSGLDYMLVTHGLDPNGLDYTVGDLRLAWTDGGAAEGTGTFTLGGGSGFEADIVLTDQAGGFASGWDGTSLTKAGEGTLVLSAANTYTGSTHVTGGTLRTDIADSFVTSGSVVVDGGTLDLNGHDQQANRLSGNGGAIQLNGATLSAHNANAEDTTAFAGDLVDGATAGGRLTKTGDGTLTLRGHTGWTGGTRIEAGELILDGSSGGAQLTGDVVGLQGASLALRNGAMLTGTIDPLDVTIDGASTWHLTGSSVVDTLTLAGTVQFAAPAQPFDAGRTLTATNWVGQGGTVTLHTELGDDTAVSDRIVIDGGQASGQTDLAIKRAGGNGAQTNVGIAVVDAVNGGMTQADAFALSAASDGYRAGFGTLSAGGYEYMLQRGGNGGLAESWYLVSAVPTDPTEPQPISVARSPEPDLYLGLARAATRMTVHTHRERKGVEGGDDAVAGWIRVEGGKLRQQHDAGLDLRGGDFLAQAGSDVWRGGAGQEGSVRLGVLGQFGRSSLRSTRVLWSPLTQQFAPATAEGTVEGYAGGMYGSWYGRDDVLSGPRVDAWATYGTYDNTLGGGLAPDAYDAKVLTGSVEAGYAFPILAREGMQLFLEPQAQVVHSRYRADAHLAPVGHVGAQDANELLTRLGVRLHGVSATSQGGQVLPFLETNWWHGSDKASVTIDGNRFTFDGDRKGRLEVRAGLQGQLAGGLSVFGTVGTETDFDAYRTLSGQLGLQYEWK